jgi:2-dehydro-3-deoxyphosphogluconate aldolase / (4S)-4-hydroxy-2-oxoglutarate aldolase
VHAPLPDIPLVPTGGIDIDTVSAWLDAGAVAVGLGSPLIGNALAPDGDLDALAQRARAVCAAVETRIR